MRKAGSDFVPLSFPDEKQNHDAWLTVTKHWQSHFVTFELREKCKDNKTIPALLAVRNPEFSRTGRRLAHLSAADKPICFLGRALRSSQPNSVRVEFLG